MYRASRTSCAQFWRPASSGTTITFYPRTLGLLVGCLHGIDEMIIELLWRKENWSNVRFVGLREQFAPGHVTQTFTISGIDRGTPFENAAVDLYTVTDDNLIAKKDTYWKYAGG